jgi:uncharacterized membrane-anchored protein
MALLEGATFASGATYADYAKGDRVAEYGLAGLVAGGAGLGAAAKMGVLAKLGKGLVALLVAGKKLIAVVVIGIVALFRRLFGNRAST